MNTRFARIVIASATTVMLVGGTAATANAWVSTGLRTQYPSAGGTWQAGFSNAQLQSNYTVSRCHGSTVQRVINGSITNTDRTVNTASGRPSNARVNTINSAGLEGKYYYRTC